MCLGIVVTVLGRGPSIAAVRDLCEAGKASAERSNPRFGRQSGHGGYRRASSFGSEADPAGLKPGDVVVRWRHKGPLTCIERVAPPESGWDGGISR